MKIYIFVLLETSYKQYFQAQLPQNGLKYLGKATCCSQFRIPQWSVVLSVAWLAADLSPLAVDKTSRIRFNCSIGWAAELYLKEETYKTQTLTQSILTIADHCYHHRNQCWSPTHLLHQMSPTLETTLLTAARPCPPSISVRLPLLVWPSTLLDQLGSFARLAVIPLPDWCFTLFQWPTHSPSSHSPTSCWWKLWWGVIHSVWAKGWDSTPIEDSEPLWEECPSKGGFWL